MQSMECNTENRKQYGYMASHATLTFQYLGQRITSQALPACTCSEEDNGQAWGQTGLSGGGACL